MASDRVISMRGSDALFMASVNLSCLSFRFHSRPSCVNLAANPLLRANNAMLQPLAKKRILLGVTGGIAAYKSADLTRRLSEAAPRCK
jgi:hypothetical protein